MAEEKKNKSKAKEIRNNQILAEVAGGKTQKEIAEDFGLCRQQVGKILSSQGAEAFAANQKLEILKMLPKAMRALDNKLDKDDLFAVNMILKAAGFFIEQIKDVSERPFVVKYLDGTEVHMGHKPEEKKDKK